MQGALDQFQSNISRVRVLGGIHATLLRTTTAALDVSDLLRAQVVLAVSAFDTLIHELCRIGMLQAAEGRRPVAKAFARWRLSYDAARKAGAGSFDWLETEIREQHQFLSFQAPTKVADAIRLVTDTNIWDAVAGPLARPAGDVKAELQLVVDRRNKIAHEADSDPSVPGARWPIDPLMVEQVITFLESLGTTIVGALI